MSRASFISSFFIVLVADSVSKSELSVGMVPGLGAEAHSGSIRLLLI